HDELPLGLRHLEFAHPEAMTEGHPHADPLEIVLRSVEDVTRIEATHMERPWRTPAERHPQLVIAPLPAGACQVVRADPRGRTLRATSPRVPRAGNLGRWEPLPDLMNQKKHRQNRRHARESTFYERTPSSGLLHEDARGPGSVGTRNMSPYSTVCRRAAQI